MTPPMSGAAKNQRQRSLHKSHLQQNPFALLGVTTRDDRRRIVELAEEKSLELDHDACQKARSDLTSPRMRLSAEMAWLPGVSPRKASQLVTTLHEDPMSIRKESGLPTLAHLNLLAAAFEAVDGNDSAGDVAEFIQEMACLVDDLSVDQVFRDINEDRSVSSFPEVMGIDQVEAELSERKRYYRNAIKDALNRLPPATLVDVMTVAVNSITCGGERHAPELLDDLVDSYAVETQDFLQKEAENAQKLIKAARDSAKSGESVVKPIVDKLEAVARNWDKVAQPIQLSAKARGIDHEPSHQIAYSIRSLAIDLFNEHDMLTQSQRLFALILELFAESPELAERVEQDSDALAEILQRRNESAAIDPIRTLCESAINSIGRNPRAANSEGLRLLNEGRKLLEDAPIKANSPTYLEAQDILAIALMQCAVAYGNETSKWEPCVSLLENALKLATEVKLRQRLSENLVIVKANHASFGDLEPVENAPSLRTINGVGVTLYGSADKNPSNGSYMATYYFVLFFIPIFPIARYRVIPTGGGFRFLGKGRLRTFDKWHIAISLGLIVLMFANG
ncbi:hypothetical protein [Pseudomonas sp. GL-B-19]|uniref:hypothetical protein n=1 Tax=Pseudomonas sp. GL-B-19 TaxID=2832393 RepID=UPI001CC0E736|nr:hypothetical protein [Pseudomonas sp. GL-B-19]